MRRCFALLKSIKNSGSNRGSNRIGSSLIKSTSLSSPQSSLAKAKTTPSTNSNINHNTEYYANVNNNKNNVFDNDLHTKRNFVSSGSVANTNGCEALARRVYLPWESRPAEYSYKTHESDWLHLDTLLNCLISNAEKVIESYGKHSGHMLLDKINRSVRKTRRYACNKIAEVVKATRTPAQSRNAKKIVNKEKTLKSKMHKNSTTTKTDKTKAKKSDASKSSTCRLAQSKSTKRESKTNGNGNRRKDAKNLYKAKSTFPTRQRIPKLHFKVITTSLIAKEKRDQKRHHVTKAIVSNSKRYVQSQRNRNKNGLKLATKLTSAKQKYNQNKFTTESKALTYKTHK